MEIENKTEGLNLEEEKDAPKDAPSADSDGVPDLVPSDSEKNKVWKFWCHQCEEILDVDPRPRDDGSLECPECRENLVERIAEDDEFLIARLEEQKEEAEEKKITGGTQCSIPLYNALCPQFRKSKRSQLTISISLHKTRRQQA